MKKLFFISLIIIVSPTVFAQPGLNWVISMGGQNVTSGSNNSNSITKDANGNVFIAGYFSGTMDFDPSANTTNLTSQGFYSDLFIAKYTATGNFLWAKQIRTNDAYPQYQAESVNMKVNSAGELLITGLFDGVQDFNPGSGVDSITTANGYGFFLLKLDNNGDYIWAKGISGSGGVKLCLDDFGNILLAGWYINSNDFNPSVGVDSLPALNFSDIFIAKYDITGNFLWVKGLQSYSGELINDIVADNTGNIYVCGNFESSVLDFDPDIAVAERYRQSVGAGTDFFVAKYNSNGAFVWANTYGHPTYTNSANSADRILLTSNNDVIVTGSISGEVDFNADTPVDTLGFASQALGVPQYFAKYNGANGNYIFAKALFGQNVNYVRGLGVDSLDNIFIASNFENFCDADPGIGKDTLATNGRAILLAEYNSTGDYLWGELITSENTDQISNISVDRNGTLYITGRAQSPADFDITAGVDSVIPIPNTYAFYIAKYGSEQVTSVIKSFAKETAMQISPNPFTNQFTLKSPLIRRGTNVIEVFDITGKKIFETLQSTENVGIETSNWSSGVYFVRVRIDEERSCMKIVKQE